MAALVRAHRNADRVAEFDYTCAMCGLDDRPAPKNDDGRAPRSYGRTLTAVYVSHLLGTMSLGMFIPFLPYYIAELGVAGTAAQKWWAGLIIGTTPAVAAVTGPLWGALGDRIGRKLMVLRGHASIAVCVAAMGFATAAWQLWVIAMLQGVFAGFVAAGNTLVSVSTPVERQGRTLGVLQTALLAGVALGPLVGGLLGDGVGHRAVFFIAAAAAFVAFVVVALVAVDADRRDDASRSSFRWRDVRGVFGDVQSELANPPVRALMGSLVCFRMAIAMMLPVLPLFLVGLDGYDPARRSTLAGLAFFAGTLPVVLCVAWWGRIADRVGPSRVYALTAGGGALLFAPFALVTSVGALFALRVAQGVLFAGPMPAAYAALSAISPVERRGAAIGLLQSALQVAMAVGPIVAAGLAVFVDVRWTFVLAMIVGLCGVALCRRGWWMAAAPRTCMEGKP